MDKRYTINLLGVGITIQSEEDIAYIEKLEKKVKETMQDVKDELGLTDNLQVAVMAAIFLADENFKASENIPKLDYPSYITNDSKAKEALKEIDSLLDDSLR